MFSIYYKYPESVLQNTFPQIFKQRVIDCFIQEWRASVERSPILYEYRHFKSEFTYERYLNALPIEFRCIVTKFRIVGHSLRVHTGRYGRPNIPRNERFCLYCGSQDVEDVYHFICICPCYTNLRKSFLDRVYYTRPSVFKYNQLMSSQDENILFKLAKYIKSALLVRNSIVV